MRSLLAKCDPFHRDWEFQRAGLCARTSFIFEPLEIFTHVGVISRPAMVSGECSTLATESVMNSPLPFRRGLPPLFVALVASMGAQGCGPDSSDGSGDSSSVGGSTGGVTSGTGGGVSGTGGVATGTGGFGTGGVVSTGGGGSGGIVGSGGASTGGSGGGSGGIGSGGSDGSGGGSGLPDPQSSDGCGKTGSATGSSGSPLTVSGHQYYVKLPSGYDANTPYPTLIVFNPTNNPISWAEQSAGYEQNAAKDEAIRVYPHPANSSAGWGAGDEPFFDAFYEKITADYCVDEARVFAAGESSGGDFASILGCEHADKLRAIAPCATKNVPQFPLNPGSRSCTGQVAAIIIHGQNDNVVGTANGPATRDFYTALNHCSSMSEPVPGYTDSMSNCVLFSGCDDGFPVYWCSHTDPNYGGTNHGWPGFAANMTWETFSSY